MVYLFVLVTMVASWVPLFFIPFMSGGWFLMGLVAGALTGYFGAGSVAMSALSDHTTNLRYYGNWAWSLLLAGGGIGLLVWSVAALIWRGAGLHVDVQVTQ